MAVVTKKGKDEILRLMRDLRGYTQKLDLVEKQVNNLETEVGRLQARVVEKKKEKDAAGGVGVGGGGGGGGGGLDGKTSIGTPKAVKRERGSKGKVSGQSIKPNLPKAKDK